MAKASAVKKDAPSTAVATVSTATLAAFGEKYSVKKRVTMPTLNPGVDQALVLKIDDAFRTSSYVDPDPKKAKEKPATICSVTNMETGEVSILLVASVLESNLREQYPDDGYVGKIFAIMKLPRRPNKRYHDWNITEVEVIA